MHVHFSYWLAFDRRASPQPINARAKALSAVETQNSGEEKGKGEKKSKWTER